MFGSSLGNERKVTVHYDSGRQNMYAEEPVFRSVQASSHLEESSRWDSRSSKSIRVDSRVQKVFISSSSSKSTTTFPQVPDFIEKRTSFWSPMDPKQLMNRLESFLTELGSVDFETKSHKVAGFYNDTTSRVCFEIRLSVKDTRVLCEVSRLQGCSVIFNKLWNQIRSSLGPEDNFQTSLDHLSLPPFDDMDEEVGVDEETLKNLVSMAEYGHLGAQREGSSALALMSQSEPVRVFMANKWDEMASMMGKLLANTDEELCRNACVLLANICMVESIRHWVVSHLIAHVLEIVNSPTSVGNRDSKRHVAKVLRECSKTQGCVLKNHPTCVPTLQRYKQTSDLALRSHVLETLKQLDCA